MGETGFVVVKVLVSWSQSTNALDCHPSSSTCWGFCLRLGARGGLLHPFVAAKNGRVRDTLLKFRLNHAPPEKLLHHDGFFHVSLGSVDVDVLKQWTLMDGSSSWGIAAWGKGTATGIDGHPMKEQRVSSQTGTRGEG